jgi:hypothetical protein
MRNTELTCKRSRGRGRNPAPDLKALQLVRARNASCSVSHYAGAGMELDPVLLSRIQFYWVFRGKVRHV